MNVTHPLPVTWQQIMISRSCFPLEAGKFLTFLLQVTLFARFTVEGLIFGVVEFLFAVCSYRVVLVLLRGTYVACG